MLKDFKKKRNRLQTYTWFGLPIVVIGGWLYPKLGYLLLGCMVGAIGVSLYKGRAWCDWMCPRGSFYDLFLQKISLKREMPDFFRKKAVRFIVLTVLISVLSLQVYTNWGDWDAIGRSMVMILTVTTLIGIILGMIFQQRVWCHICPMGTLGNQLSDGKMPLTVDDTCVDCKLCSNVCPMQLKPYLYKGEGLMKDNDCIKCSICTVACPAKALNFEDIRKAA